MDLEFIRAYLLEGCFSDAGVPLNWEDLVEVGVQLGGKCAFLAVLANAYPPMSLIGDHGFSPGLEQCFMITSVPTERHCLGDLGA